jgi:hypothetical protein
LSDKAKTITRIKLMESFSPLQSNQAKKFAAASARSADLVEPTRQLLLRRKHTHVTNLSAGRL